MSTQPHLPAGPLLERLGPVKSRGEAAAEAINEGRCRQPEPQKSAIRRARRDGWITVWMADRLALELFGCHPIEIWGDAWLGDNDDDDC